MGDYSIGEWISSLTTDFEERARLEEKQRTVDRKRMADRREELGRVLYSLFLEYRSECKEVWSTDLGKIKMQSAWERETEQEREVWIEGAVGLLNFVLNQKIKKGSLVTRGSEYGKINRLTLRENCMKPIAESNAK